MRNSLKNLKIWVTAFMVWVLFSGVSACKEKPKFFEESTQFPLFSEQISAKTSDFFSLAGLPLESRIVVINFFAPDCPPCITELPELEKFKKSAKGNELMFISVGSNLRAIGQNVSPQDTGIMRKELASFIKKYQLKPPVYYADSAALTGFGITGFPETFIFKREKSGKFILFRKMISAVTEKELTEATKGDKVSPY